MRYLILFTVSLFVSTAVFGANVEITRARPPKTKITKEQRREMQTMMKSITDAAQASFKADGFYPDGIDDLVLSKKTLKDMERFKLDYFGDEDAFMAEVQLGEHTMVVAEAEEITVVE